MKRKLISAVLTLVMVLSVIAFVPAKEAKAATYRFLYSTYNIYYDSLDVASPVRGYSHVDISGAYSLDASAIKNLKCSNSSVYVYARKGGRITFSAPTKQMTFTISCTVGGQKIKTTVKMVPVIKAFKTFNIGSRKLAAAFKSTESLYTINPITKANGNTVITVNNGWKITGYYYYNSGSESKSESGKSLTTLKLGKLAFDGSVSHLDITVKHAKSNITRTFEFRYVD